MKNRLPSISRNFSPSQLSCNKCRQCRFTQKQQHQPNKKKEKSSVYVRSENKLPKIMFLSSLHRNDFHKSQKYTHLRVRVEGGSLKGLLLPLTHSVFYDSSLKKDVERLWNQIKIRKWVYFEFFKIIFKFSDFFSEFLI